MLGVTLRFLNLPQLHIEANDGAFKLGRFQPTKPIFSKEISTYSKDKSSISLFLHAGKMAPTVVPRSECDQYGHWAFNRAIHIQQNQFSMSKFPLLQKPDAAFPFPCMLGKGHPQLTLKVFL